MILSSLNLVNRIDCSLCLEKDCLNFLQWQHGPSTVHPFVESWLIGNALVITALALCALCDSHFQLAKSQL